MNDVISIFPKKEPLPEQNNLPGTLATLVGPQAPALGAFPCVKETALNNSNETAVIDETPHNERVKRLKKATEIYQMTKSRNMPVREAII